MFVDTEPMAINVIRTASDYLRLPRAGTENVKKARLAVLDGLNLASAPISETHQTFEKPCYDVVRGSLAYLLMLGNYANVRLTMPEMEQTGTGLLVSHLSTFNDLQLGKLNPKLVNSALKAEIFARPHSQVFEIGNTHCNLGGAFVATVLDVQENKISIMVEAALNDNSKREIGKPDVPQISKVYVMPIDRQGIIFPYVNLPPGTTKLTPEFASDLLVSHVFSKNKLEVSRLVAAMLEVYPEPGANQFAGVFTTQNDRVQGYLTDFETLDLPLLEMEKKNINRRKNRKVALPDLRWDRYLLRQNFYTQFRNSELSHLIDVPVAAQNYLFNCFG